MLFATQNGMKPRTKGLWLATGSAVFVGAGWVGCNQLSAPPAALTNTSSSQTYPKPLPPEPMTPQRKVQPENTQTPEPREQAAGTDVISKPPPEPTAPPVPTPTTEKNTEEAQKQLTDLQSQMDAQKQKIAAIQSQNQADQQLAIASTNGQDAVIQQTKTQTDLALQQLTHEIQQQQEVVTRARHEYEHNVQINIDTDLLRSTEATYRAANEKLQALRNQFATTAAQGSRLVEQQAASLRTQQQAGQVREQDAYQSALASAQDELRKLEAQYALVQQQLKSSQ